MDRWGGRGGRGGRGRGESGRFVIVRVTRMVQVMSHSIFVQMGGFSKIPRGTESRGSFGVKCVLSNLHMLAIQTNGMSIADQLKILMIVCEIGYGFTTAESITIKNVGLIDQ